MAEKQTKLEVVGDAEIDQQPIQVPKPEEKPSLDKFKSKSAASIGGVETLLTGLPHHTISEARDFVRLHDDENRYWSPELCFVNVPIIGQKKDVLHLIAEDIAVQYLPSSRIQRFRLALATKPHDSFFLCHVPSRNLDNQWNETSLNGCIKAKTHWVLVTSRREEGYESYKITYAKDQDAFPKPNWLNQSLIDLILRTYEGRQIEDAKHPGLLRLIGARQKLS
jgi:hypothetical protein